MARKKITKKPTKRYPPRKEDVPATCGMLFRVRDELKAEIKAETQSLRSETQSLRSETQFLRSETQSLKLEIRSLRSEMESRFDSLIQNVSAQIHKLALLVEEQNARNAIVLDGLASLFHRQERVETELREQRKLIAGIKRFTGTSK